MMKICTSLRPKGALELLRGISRKLSAGKSTFFNASINSDTTKPAVIGAYPFTTIEPNFCLANVAIEVPRPKIALGKIALPILLSALRMLLV